MNSITDQQYNDGMATLEKEEQERQHQKEQRTFSENFQKGLDWAWELATQSARNSNPK